MLRGKVEGNDVPRAGRELEEVLLAGPHHYAPQEPHELPAASLVALEHRLLDGRLPCLLREAKLLLQHVNPAKKAKQLNNVSWPYTEAEAGRHFWRRLLALLPGECSSFSSAFAAFSLVPLPREETQGADAGGRCGPLSVCCSGGVGGGLSLSCFWWRHFAASVVPPCQEHQSTSRGGKQSNKKRGREDKWRGAKGKGESYGRERGKGGEVLKERE